MTQVNIILASSSPRRKNLLETIKLDFEIILPDDVESEIQNFVPLQDFFSRYVEDIAFSKAQNVADKILLNPLKEKTKIRGTMERDSKDSLIIGADTIVAIDNKILGKPKTEQEAYEMLQTLNDRWHEVFTGVAIISPSQSVKAHKISKVKFKKLTDEEIKSYIKTKEPMDKAGAYALQGIGSVFVEKIDGCYTNVIGLPLPLLDDLFKQYFDFSILKGYLL